jgi:rod shape-determining protein MreD
MRPFRVLFLLLGALLLQWFCAMYLSIGETTPQLLPVLTAAVAAVGGSVPGQLFGFAWGISLDTTSGHVFGANALALSVMAYLVGRLRRQMDVSGKASQAILAAGVALALPLAVGLVGLAFEHVFLWPGWKQFLAGPLYAALVAPKAFQVSTKALGGRP